MNRINETESPHAELRDALFNVVGIIALVFVVAAALRLLWALLKWQSPDTACLVQQSLGLICN